MPTTMIAREAGFDHHLAKPVDFDSLQKLLVSIEADAWNAPVGNEAAACSESVGTLAVT
jgi:hypothetical protein